MVSSVLGSAGPPPSQALELARCPLLPTSRRLAHGTWDFYYPTNGNFSDHSLVHDHKMPRGRVGVSEYLMCNMLGGALNAVAGGQPLLVLRPTGPITLILVELYRISGKLDLPFGPWLALVGLFVGTYMMLIALLDLCALIRYFSRFVHDLFSFFICTIYIRDGLQGVFGRYHTKGVSDADATFALFLATVTFGGAAALSCLGTVRPRSAVEADASGYGRTPGRLRAFLSAYSLTIAVFVAVFVSYLPSVNVERLPLPRAFGPTWPGRPWMVSLSGLPGWSVPVAMAAAVPIVFLFYIDQNISSQLTQVPQNNLKKGAYYHSSFLLLAVANLFLPCLGLPFITGSLPHSPQFVQALTTSVPPTTATNRRTLADPLRAPHVDAPAAAPASSTEDLAASPHGAARFEGQLPDAVLAGEVDQGEEFEMPSVRVVNENRMSPLVMYLLMGSGLILPSVLKRIPQACTDAIIGYVGAAGLLQGNEMFTRVLFLLLSPIRRCLSLAPPSWAAAVERPFPQLPVSRIHSYTVMQLALLGICWAISLSPYGLAFPLFIVLLVPFRLFAVTRLFSPAELRLLDRDGGQGDAKSCGWVAEADEIVLRARGAANAKKGRAGEANLNGSRPVTPEVVMEAVTPNNNHAMRLSMV
eukprot:jgi/Mesvir1/6525/Mv16789-RA.1